MGKNLTKLLVGIGLLAGGLIIFGEGYENVRPNIEIIDYANILKEGLKGGLGVAMSVAGTIIGYDELKRKSK